MKAVVFDMDGVLTDTEKIYRIYWKQEGMKLGLSEEEMTVICDRIAGGTRKTNAGVFKEKLGEDFDYMSYRARVMEEFNRHIHEHGVELKSNVRETLEYLKEKGVRLAVATSTYREKAEERLQMAGIYDYFDAMIYGDDIEKGKPEPDIYLKACEALSVSPKDAVGVEDSINGVIASSAAGLYTVMVVDLIPPNAITKEKANQIAENISILTDIYKSTCSYI